MNFNLKTLKEYIIITISMCINTSAVYFFLIPSNVSVGSISGLAIVLSNLVPLSISAITMVLNVGLLVVGFLLIGREFGAKTVYASVLMPLILGFWERVLPNITSIMGDPFVDMICYIFFVSIGQAIIFNQNASTGGLDIIAKMMNKFLHMELGNALSVVGMAVALSSALVYDAKIVVLSVIGTYLNGIVLDHFIFGFNLKRRVCIMSECEQEIRDFIHHELKVWATVYESYSGPSLKHCREILTIVDKNQYGKLMRFIEKTDGDAFVTVYSVSRTIRRHYE